MIRPILLLEINEIPWRIIDHFKNEPNLPNIRRFFGEARTYTTMAADQGELSPWVTWPTFHRGMSNAEHGVADLGQDPATFKGTPIWEEFRKQGHAVGICGSMQSWPPKDPGSGGFYIPDTFAHDESCIPKFVEPFQRYNLKQVRTNPRVVKANSLVNMELVPLLASLPRLGISARTIALLSRQLVQERFDKTYLSRRPIFQTLLLWDVFKRLFKPESPPAFATFFTNHVAGVMHRYWHNIFPEDFGERYRNVPRPYLATMFFALEVLDQMLCDAMGFESSNPDLIVVAATSMGQGPIVRPRHDGVEVTLVHPGKLLAVCGLKPENYSPLLAMTPQVAFAIPDPGVRAELRKQLDEARSLGGTKLFTMRESGESLSISFFFPPLKDIKHGTFTMLGRQVSWEEAGMNVHQIDPGTAYHIPEGILAVQGRGQSPSDKREVLSARDAKKFLMGLSGLAPE